MTKLAISPELQLPVDAVTETFGILAVKRAGKSNAAVVMAEEMFDAGLPWVAIDPKGDWWGIRSSADGKGPGLPILVLGGLHGDVPLEASAGHLVADLVVDQRLTCVIDVSEMSKADQRRFLADFAERLYKRNREPLHVFCEEADEYIPQMVRGDVARLVGAFETLVKRGGFRGLGITLITQRSASLNKDVLTQVQTLFAMRTTSPQGGSSPNKKPSGRRNPCHHPESTGHRATKSGSARLRIKRSPSAALSTARSAARTSQSKSSTRPATAVADSQKARRRWQVLSSNQPSPSSAA